MDPSIIGYVGFAVLLALIALGVPIGLAMAAIGIVGSYILTGFTATVAQVGMNAWEESTDFILIALPMFVLMGQLVFHLRLAEDLYDAVQKWLGRLPGGMAITAVVASAVFGAVTGVSSASVATMGAMTMPEMRRYKYDEALASGSIAAAGTLAILIPPSVLMIVYGIWTETSIGALFIAGMIPGILLTLAFAILIYVRCWLRPEMGPIGPRYSWRERFGSLRKLLPIIAIFFVVIGGIYVGAFTPTEASAIGVIGVLIVGLFMRRLNAACFKDSLIDTGTTTGMIFAIIIGGHLIGRFLVLTDVTSGLVTWIGDSGLNRYVILSLFVLMYLVLGALLDVWGMLILTLPFVFPVMMSLKFDPVWFGIFVVLMTELALITPPVGINVYVMHGIAPEVGLTTIFRGTLPFVFVILAFVSLITVFPQIVLWLPSVSMR
ncbi:MAG: TRAP transporter large permease subunit [Pseudolabrys sp.]